MATISSDAQAVIQQAGLGAQEYIQSQGGYGNVLTSGEAKRLLAGFTPQQTVGQQVQSGIAALASNQYQFDPNQYLPQIQSTAESIYSPQQAQLEAIRQLQQLSYQDTKVQTEKDFQKRLKQEVEAMNRRGSYFSGGAILNEQDIRSRQESALTQLSLQNQAAQYSNYAQQAVLAAEKTQFIQDRLVNAENSAYARWTDQRNFSLQALQTQYQVYADQRNFARSVFESDRAYNLEVSKFNELKSEFKKQFGLDEARFKQAQYQYQKSLKSGTSEEVTLTDFLARWATKNDGVLGTNGQGQDNYEVAASTYPVANTIGNTSGLSSWKNTSNNTGWSFQFAPHP